MLKPLKKWLRYARNKKYICQINNNKNKIGIYQ